MKKIKSTLDEFYTRAYKKGRAVGNTTRQVDYAIELLFEGHIVEARDHYKLGDDRAANKMLFEKIIMRLYNEHPQVDKSLNINQLNIKLENL